MADIFAGKNIVVGVTGSIAAFKVAGWVSDLAKREALVSVIMTSAACEFVTPLTFGALSGRKVHTGMFDTAESMAHISLAQDADLVLIAPATANTMAGLACGMAGDLLATTVLATRAPVLICPAMNSNMFSHPASVENRKRLTSLGYEVIDPDSGMMACKQEGPGRLPEWDKVLEYVARGLSRADLLGKRVLVTAGPTREPLDPARFLSNRSSGKMGYALARAAWRRGAEVTLVSGPVALEAPAGVSLIPVESAQEMHNAVIEHASQADVIIKAAAVADYRPALYSQHKVKKNEIEHELRMEQNPDILFELGKQRKEGQLLVGFAAESRNLEAEGKRKLLKKNLDLIAVNDISAENSGFETDTNRILLLGRDIETWLPLTSKLHTADLILDRVVGLFL